MRFPARLWPWLLCGLLAACGTTGPEAQRYELVGQILAVRPETQELLIKHQDIPNFMPGMTMPFKVRDRALLERSTAGDLVRATLVVEPDAAWIAAVEKTGTAPLTDAPPSLPVAAGLAPLEPGMKAPDAELIDQDGQPLRLADWEGRAVAVTFIYTRCPLPQFCPMLDRRFAEVQRIVSADTALADSVRLLSVSFDPDTDTPARLRAHASKLGANPHMWRFATAPREVVDRLAAGFGVNVIREDDRTITHNMQTVVIAPDGTVAAIHRGSDWTASMLAEDLRAASADRVGRTDPAR